MDILKSQTEIDLEMTGNNIRKHTYAYGYTVKDIQGYLGLSCPQPVYRWFKGKILPSVDNLLRLSELLHVHMEDLLVKRKTQRIYRNSMFEDSDAKSLMFRMNFYCSQIVA